MLSALVVVSLAPPVPLSPLAGLTTPPPLPAGAGATGFALDTIYDETVEAAARAAYGRDYTAFGFGDWRS